MNSYETQLQIQTACENHMEDLVLSVKSMDELKPLDREAAVLDVAKRTGLPVEVVRPQAAAYFAECI